jgi:steroid 5-alpha reductase family enzyme
VSDTYPTGRSLAGLSRFAAFAVVTAGYVLAGAAGLAVVGLLDDRHPVTIAFVADLVATLVVFVVAMAVANSSLYDPYWSVLPPAVAIGWALQAEGLSSAQTTRQVVVLVVVGLWAVRLTGNWVIGWHGLTQEDWRYVDMRADTRGRLPWWLVSLVGVMLVPTLIVFVGLLPLWPALGDPDRGFNVLDVLALALGVVAVLLELVADNQMRAFARDPANRGRTVDVGLWRHSRHPNYLGEICFWWSLWLFGLAADPSWWWTVIGPLSMVALFEAVSIPMMEKRSLARRGDAFVRYQREVPRLLPVRQRKRA